MGRRTARGRTSGEWTLRMVVALCASFATGDAVAAQAVPSDYRVACTAGDLVACSVLGLLYERGEGVPADAEQAVALYEHACAGEEPSACASLGRMYAEGAGVERDAERALELFALACRQGDRWSCEQLDADAASLRSFFKSGRVGDAETALPLGDAVVEVPGAGVRVSTDASGRFALRGLPEGRHRIRVERLGYETLEGGLEVPGEPHLLLLLVREPSASADAPGRIAGRVAEVGGAALGEVDVVVEDRDGARVVTGRSGRFLLDGIAPGLVRLRFERLGYASRGVELVVRPGRTTDVEVTLATRPIELDPIEVTVRSDFLERAGFYRRARRGMGGVQFDRTDIEDLRPLLISDLMRRVPGVQMRYENGQARAVARRRYDRGTCTLSVRVDGADTWTSDLDWLPPDNVEAVEVYYGLSMPIEYTSRFGACGVVMIWTRRR